VGVYLRKCLTHYYKLSFPWELEEDKTFVSWSLAGVETAREFPEQPTQRYERKAQEVDLEMEF